MEPLLDLIGLRCHQDRGVVSNIPHYITIPCIALILLSTAPAAPQSVIDEVYHVCNRASFNSNETFADNFNAVVKSLTQNSSNTLYSTALSDFGPQSSYVHGFYQCRGDISLSDCFSCVSNALSSITTKTGICRYAARGVRVQYEGCYIRYENYDFPISEMNCAFTFCSTSIDSSPVYQHNLATALNNSASAAPKHALFGYNASSVGTGSVTAYALSQCVGFISSSDCATCLSSVSNYSGVCNNSVSGGVYFVDCYYLYDNTSFHLTSTPSANPQASPQRSPIVISSTQADRSKKHSKTTPIIVGIVVGTSLAIAIIITLALCYLKRRKTATNYKLEQGPSIYAGVGDELLPQPGGGATRFSLKELQEATANFHPTNKLGEGGFGPVYQVICLQLLISIRILSSLSKEAYPMPIPPA